MFKPNRMKPSYVELRNQTVQFHACFSIPHLLELIKVVKSAYNEFKMVNRSSNGSITQDIQLAKFRH
jgi:hypothetical protein